ncbi:MAG: glycosyltransferase [Candidatus Calescibacterium sp.]|nr:glycosyltransferase [Candidatus Calescibacterium sp.]MDW8133371.1 glycosyltransferase [Candidatus Calescibacterium sp.]
MTINNKPLVSIIIINYNYGQYVGQAIKSALLQTYHPLEIIVVDDGSTDNSIEVIKQYPVNLIRQENKGISSAVDTGVRACKGIYYVILSADDLLHPLYVERTVEILESNPEISFVYTQVVIFGAQSGLFLSHPYNVKALLKSNYITGTALIRRKVYEAVGGYDPELPYAEDWDHWLTLAEKGYYGILLPEPLFYWRRHFQGSRNTQSRKTIKLTLKKIRQKHRLLYLKHFPFFPFDFFFINFFERVFIKYFRMVDSILFSLIGDNIVSNRLSLLFGKIIGRRGFFCKALPTHLQKTLKNFIEDVNK